MDKFSAMKISFGEFTRRHGLTEEETRRAGSLIQRSYLDEKKRIVEGRFFLEYSKIARELDDFLLGKLVVSEEVVGMENFYAAISSGKRVILACNHISHTDALIVRYLLALHGFTDEVCWVAGHKVWEEPEVRIYSTGVNMYLIYSGKYKRQERDRKNFENVDRMQWHNSNALRLMARDMCPVGFFPEGTRGDSGDGANLDGDPESMKALELMDFGARNGIVIVPIHHFGSGHILNQSENKASSDFLRYTNSGPVRLVFGAPFYWGDIWPTDVPKEGKMKARETAVREIMSRIAELKE